MIVKYSAAFPHRAAMRRTLTILLFLSVHSAAALAADPAAGERVFRKCLACHAVGDGGDQAPIARQPTRLAGGGDAGRSTFWNGHGVSPRRNWQSKSAK